MKYILVLLVLVGILQSDMLKKKTLACPSVLLLKKAPVDVANASMDMTMYAIANNCEILSKRDKVEAVGYDISNTEAIYQEIIYQKTGATLYIHSSAIQIEQSGKKSSYRF